jgi:hypothetical protein
MKIHSVLKFLTGTLLMALACLASSQAAQFPDWTRIGLTQETREPAYWLERAPLAETVLISPQTIADRNELGQTGRKVLALRTSVNAFKRSQDVLNQPSLSIQRRLLRILRSMLGWKT